MHVYSIKADIETQKRTRVIFAEIYEGFSKMAGELGKHGKSYKNYLSQEAIDLINAMEARKS